jgi:hypothetical protein
MISWPIRKQDTKRNNQSTAETHTSFDMSRNSKSKDHTKALNIPLTLTQGDLLQEATTCIALYTTFHCGNDKLIPTLVGIVSTFQNLRSTLLLPFHSVSSAYLPAPRGPLTGMFNAWDNASYEKGSNPESLRMERDWKRPYLYLKTEGQNWGQWTIKWLEKIKWKRLRNITWTQSEQ